VIEMLCVQWGFYFNAAKSDLGSGDLSQLAGFIDSKTNEEQSPAQNTAFAKEHDPCAFPLSAFGPQILSAGP